MTIGLMALSGGHGSGEPLTTANVLLALSIPILIFSYLIYAFIRAYIADKNDKPSDREIFMTKLYALGLKHTSLSRNELCPCGSGKKYKKCCYSVV